MDPFTLPDQLAEDLSMFQAALHAPAETPALPPIGTIAVCLDGSNQDDSARRLAQAVAAALGGKVQEHASAGTAAEILRALAAAPADLLVAPVPFGRDIRELRDESLGSVVDMLLCEASCPLLCVRQPCDPSVALGDILLPLHFADAGGPRAAAWAMKLAAPSATIGLVAVADVDAIAEAQRLLSALPSAPDPAALGRAALEASGGVVGLVQRHCASTGTQVHVAAKVGRWAKVVADEANLRPRLTVVSASQDHGSPGYHRAADLILNARGPVLVVF